MPMTSVSPLHRTLLAAGALAASLAFAPALAATPKTVDIATARSLPLGTVVTVKGSVTTPSGAFASSFFDEGFALQDRTAGIYVSTAKNPHLVPRQEATVTGQLQDSGGLLILVPTSNAQISVHGRGRRVRPRFVSTGGIGESTEGFIVRVVGTIVEPVEPDLPYGYKVFVDDGTGTIRVFVNTTTGIDVSGLAQGQVVSVTGFSGQFEDYEIDPRFPADIVVRSH
jgi:hypothetical protein